MPSQQRNLFPNSIHHIYNRGSQKMTLFYTAQDYERFLWKIREFKKRYPLEILAYCIMPTHFHMLVRVIDQIDLGGRGDLQGLEGQDKNVPLFFQQLQNSYAKYFALRHEYSGHVFQGKYKSKYVDNDAYYLTLCTYIHDNPVRKGLTDSPANWPYSSYLDLVGIRDDTITTDDTMITDMNHKEIYETFIQNRETSIDYLKTYLI